MNEDGGLWSLNKHAYHDRMSEATTHNSFVRSCSMSRLSHEESYRFVIQCFMLCDGEEVPWFVSYSPRPLLLLHVY